MIHFHLKESDLHALTSDRLHDARAAFSPSAESFTCMTLLYLHSNCCSPTVTCVQKKKKKKRSLLDRDKKRRTESLQRKSGGGGRFPPHHLMEALVIICLTSMLHIQPACNPTPDQCSLCISTDPPPTPRQVCAGERWTRAPVNANVCPRVRRGL